MDTEHHDPIEVHQEYNVAPEVIFNAWIIPDLIAKWLFVGKHSSVINVDIDFKIGGKFSILEFDQHTHQTIDHFGEYLDLLPPQHLAFTLSVPKQFKGFTHVFIEITGIANGGCKLKLVQTGVAPKLIKSWKKMLKKLQSIENEL